MVLASKDKSPNIDDFSSSLEVCSAATVSQQSSTDVVPPTPRSPQPPSIGRLHLIAPRALTAAIGAATRGSSSESEQDVSGHEVWDDSGCSTPPPSCEVPSVKGTPPAFTPASILESEISAASKSESEAPSARMKHLLFLHPLAP